MLTGRFRHRADHLDAQSTFVFIRQQFARMGNCSARVRGRVPKGLWPVLFLAALPVSFGADGPGISASEFHAQAFAALPVEKAYAFHKALSAGGWQVRRDPLAKPIPGEMAIPEDGWVILVKSGASEPLRMAADDLRDYFETAMHAHVNRESQASLAGWEKRDGTIVAATRRELPGCGNSLTGSKDYQILVTPKHIVVCGYDELGAMYGLYNLEERMDLREAPFLPRGLNTQRHSLHTTRMTLSGLGWMEWPDNYLASLPRYGFDSIFASVYANPNGAPAPIYYADVPTSVSQRFRRQDPGRLSDLIHRAARYGISVYCPILYEYTGTPENEKNLRKLVREMVTQFPGIRGYVLLTEGFYYKTWFGAGGHGALNLRDWVTNWAGGVSIVAEECRKLNPAIEVLPWDYNIDFRPDQVDLKKFVIDQLPRDTIPLVTFENGKSFSFDGQTSYLRDYAISQVGPSEVAAAQIAEAKKRRMRGVYANADTWSSQQFGTSPHLPFPYQWYQRYQALEASGVDGTMESWTPGFKPNFVAELRTWYSWTDAPPLDDLLRQIARRDFGSGSEGLVLEAWKQFSAAIRLNPDTGPTAGGNNAVANPLFFEQPESHIATLEHSFVDHQLWVKATGVNPYWPYVIGTSYLIYPDFTNQVNVAARYAMPFSLEVFKKYLLEAASEMERGLEGYRRAALNAPSAKRLNAFREVLLAEQIQRMLQSNAAVLEFEDSRFHLANSHDASERSRLLDRMTEILKEEVVRTRASLETARRDSRLGYAWEQDYLYWPEVLEKKLQLLQATFDEQIPAYRHQHP
jgi:hypothetical protein